MQLNEYFGDWLEVIDINELNKVVNKLNAIVQSKPIVPEYTNIFKAFTLCTRHDVKIVFDINSNALEMYYDEKGRYIKAGNDEI